MFIPLLEAPRALTNVSSILTTVQGRIQGGGALKLEKI